VADLLGEAMVTAQFDHRNLIKLIGVVTTGNPIMLVLQLAEKGSLHSALQGNHA